MAREVNGVFKGGGAKGIAYAGALEACELSDIEFKAVAGSSAGAITAALVACGYSGSDLNKEMPVALGSIDEVAPSLAMIGLRSSLLGNHHLTEWIASAVARRINAEYADQCAAGDNGNPPAVTFKEIYDKTGVTLYVVTLDLATRQPVVFSPDLTPHSPVAPAVVASSAIPVAFPAARMTIRGDVHRLVDGGTWANYPAFVFRDNDFRHCHALEVNDRPTIGFILDDGEPPRRLDPESESPIPKPGPYLFGDQGSSTQQMSLVGATLSSPIFRWLAALVPLLFILLSVLFVRDEVLLRGSVIAKLPESMQDLMLVLAVALLSITGLLAVGLSFVMLRLGAALFDSGIVGASAAMGVGPSVPYWVGTRSAAMSDADHVAVRIAVPPELTTLKFDANLDLQTEARRAGYEATMRSLTGVPGIEPPQDRPEHPGEQGEPGAYQPKLIGPRVLLKPVFTPLRLILVLLARLVAWATHKMTNGRYVRMVTIVFSIVLSTVATFAALKGFSEGRVLFPLLWLGVVGLAVVLLVWLMAFVRYREATEDAPYRLLSRLPAGALRLLSLLAMLAAAFASLVIFIPDATSILVGLDTDRVEATVQDVRSLDPAIDPGLTRYSDSYRVDGGVHQVVEVLLPAPVLDGVTKLRGVDLQPVVRCEAVGDTVCLSLLGSISHDHSVGEAVDMRVGADTGLVFFDADLWDSSRGMSWAIAALLMALGTLTVMFRARRARAWVLQHADAD